MVEASGSILLRIKAVLIKLMVFPVTHLIQRLPVFIEQRVYAARLGGVLSVFLHAHNGARKLHARTQINICFAFIDSLPNTLSVS